MTRFVLGAGALVVAGAGCGGHKTATPPLTRPATTTGPAAQPTRTTGGGAPGALQAEANATAAGDIPDNQVFLVEAGVRGAAAGANGSAGAGLGLLLAG
jgi:hypothetical protein